MTGDLPAMRAFLEENGYVVLKEKSYRQAQERQRIAEALRVYADERRESTERWAQSVCVEERRLWDRITFIYGVARANGATVEELAGEPWKATP